MSLYNQLMTFIAVAEEKSFSRAAEKLQITPTAVSKQIKLLETKLRQPLFDRNTRKVRITDLGERLYLHGKRLANEFSVMLDFIQLQEEEPQGKLRVHCSVAFANTVLVKNLQEFHTCYPHIQLEVMIDDRVPNLERDELDIIVGFSRLPGIPDYLRSRRLLTSEYVLCAAPHYLKKYGMPRVPEDLKSHKLINHPLRQPNNLIRFRNGTEIYLQTPEIIINSIEALLTLCCDGAGIMLVSEIQARKLLKQGLLTRLLPNFILNETAAYLYFKPSLYEQKKIRCFIDFFVEKSEIHYSAND